jgi:polar amino acid transport system substrate-binding protein
MRSLIGAFGLLLSILCPGAPLSAGDSATMKIVYTDYRPYSWEEGGRVLGLEVDLLEEALHKRLGIKLEHKVLPWERAQQQVRSGLADAFVASPSPARLVYAVASREPVSYWDLSLFFRKGDRRLAGIKSLEELAPLRIGTLLGNAWVKDKLGNLQVQYLATMEQLPPTLLAGRFDVIPDNPYVIHHLLKQGGYAAEIGETSLSGHRTEMLLYIGKESAFASRLEALDQALQSMRADGTWQHIHAQYRIDN